MSVGTMTFVYHLYRAFAGRKEVCDKDKRSSHFERGWGGTASGFSVLHNLGRGGTDTRPDHTRRVQGGVLGRVRGDNRGRCVLNVMVTFGN